MQSPAHDGDVAGLTLGLPLGLADGLPLGLTLGLALGDAVGGTTGTAVSYDDAKGRYNVKLDKTGSTLALKPQNLTAKGGGK